MNAKKSIIVLLALMLAGIAFADKSRFYENGKVIDTMYVDSAEGLRVRNAPNLSGKKSALFRI